MVKGVFDEKIPLLSSDYFGLLRGIFIGLLFSFCSQRDCFSAVLLVPIKSEKPLKIAVFVVEEGGFEPPKSLTADLQSAPFGRSGTLPFVWSW